MEQLGAGQRMIAKLGTEAVGTFFLCMLVSLNTQFMPLRPLAIGIGLVALVYGGYEVSGAAYNPAVVLSLLVSSPGRDKPVIAPLEALLYVVVELVFATLGALTAEGLTGGKGDVPGVAPGTHWYQAFAAEVTFTFLLCWVILSTASSRRAQTVHSYGMAVGFTVCAAAFCAGPISGAVLNPAIGSGTEFGKAIVTASATPLKWLWLYWAAPATGALLAALGFRLTNPHEYGPSLDTLRHRAAHHTGLVQDGFM